MTQEIEEELLFLKVKSRNTVLVGKDEISKVLSFVGGARDPLPHFFKLQMSIKDTFLPSDF